MKTVISASRRTDLPAFFPEFLAAALRAGRAEVVGPGGRARIVDLSPAAVHTLVLWSKDFTRVIDNAAGLRTALQAYDQLYFLFTVTGLGGTRLERGVPGPDEMLAQLPILAELAGDPRRVSIRFDPVVFWREGSRERTNLDSFSKVAAAAARAGVIDIRFSATQWYGKAPRRARNKGLDFVDPPEAVKLEAARRMAAVAREHGLTLHACAQEFLARVPGVKVSSCIDGARLTELHPSGEEAAAFKDPGQRRECGCTRSVDIGSYTQACAHGCLYCYANPKI